MKLLLERWNKFINENKDIIENFKFDQIVKKYDTEDYIVAIYFKNKNNLRVLSKMFYEVFRSVNASKVFAKRDILS